MAHSGNPPLVLIVEDNDPDVFLVQEALRAQGYTDVGHIVEFFGKSPASRRVQTEAAVPAVPAS